MKKLPTALEFLKEAQSNPSKGWTAQKAMIEFAKLHVEAALEAAANEYYPKDKENFELVAERFINAYSLENIK
jgi:hypothetical protein